ncbi:MAG: glycosyltransferase family 2 protein [Planctomycetes bacterium]|nr:glycosyltransferase family 2 protein [Planctomycetota bacterium]
MRVHQLESLQDVDRPEDLGLQGKDYGRGTPWLSIVIPARDEAAMLPRTLAKLPISELLEVIVVDGHSGDETAALAIRLGCRVIQCPAGRARQMNAGAAVARGKALLFLHADTHLPDGFMENIRQALSKPGTAAGAFRLKINGASFKYRLVECLVNLRSYLRQRPYGDQALFVASDLFRKLGGYRELPVMEDFEFVLRLRRHGHIDVQRDCVLTSARSWETCGVLKTTWINQLSILGYWIGVAPERLAWWREAQRGYVKGDNRSTSHSEPADGIEASSPISHP